MEMELGSNLGGSRFVTEEINLRLGEQARPANDGVALYDADVSMK